MRRAPLNIEATLISSVDYNSWIESREGLALAASLPKDTILAEGLSGFDGKEFED